MAKLEYKTSIVFNEILRLIELLKVLKRYKINIDGLESLETELKRHSVSQDKWTLNTKLIFKNIKKADLKIPNDIDKNITDVLLELKVNITERAYFVDSIGDSIEQNASVKYGIQLITFGKTNNISNYKMSWHLDKHIRSIGGSDGIGKGFVHPEYHFNMGGFAMTKEAGFNFGNVLLIDTPRLIHPPLDLILSIDFVLKNFYGIRVNNLLDSKVYKKIISSAKKRLWRPYYIALANHWESPRFNDLKIQDDYANMILGDK